MNKILIFAGTTEGRMLAEFCAENQIPADVSTATPYGASLLPEKIPRFTGRMDAVQIGNLLRTNKYQNVIDATHPFAENITHILQSICNEYGIQYTRLLRNPEPVYGETFSSLDEIILELNKNNQRILSTLGSKSASALTAVSRFKERLTLRILPSEETMQSCIRMGYMPEQIIQAKGPFSVEQNLRHIALSKAEIMLTKESGAAGGYYEKYEAAKKSQIRFLTLRRPEESGSSFEEVTAMLLELRGECK